MIGRRNASQKGEMMKKIPKKLLEDFVETSKAYWNTKWSQLWYERVEMARELQAATGVDWVAIIGLIDALVMPGGFNPDAELDEIYCVLRVSGWEVVDDG